LTTVHYLFPPSPFISRPLLFSLLLVSWPTGWFDKPAHCYGVGGAILARGHAQNYDQSDVIARLTGVELKNWLEVQNATNAGTSLHFIAHSMGNIVVSEALRHAAGPLITSYTASQAAEAGGSYDSSVPDMLHNNVIPGVGEQSPVEAWRYYNESAYEDSDYAIPPDIYRFGNMIVENNGRFEVKHKQTATEQQLREQFGTDPDPYHNSRYASITGKAERIVNFFNARDAALSAWEFNQLTKPDSTMGPVWEYSNEQICHAADYDPITGETIAWAYPDGNSCAGPAVAEVSSRFYRDSQQLSWDPTLPLNGTQEQTQFAQILGHIVPARTNALGQLENLPVGFYDMNSWRSFTDSNQGHSSQFHGYLSEPERERRNYWQSILSQSMLLNPDADYSGLN
jgi:hypothetical protein